MEICKTFLTNFPVIQYLHFTVTTNASNLGQKFSKEKILNDLPLCYASRTLNTNKFIQKVFEHFRPYLVSTNNNNIYSKLIIWKLQLADYDYEIVYKQRKQNTNVVALSRIEIHPTVTELK